MGRVSGCRVGAVLLAIGLAAGCSGASVASVAVSQTEVCNSPGASLAREVGEETLYRGIPLDCTVDGSDPRVGGTQEGVLSVLEHADGSAELWLSYRLTNDGGGWTGAASGLIAAGYTTHRIHVSAAGTGAYSRLRLELDVVSEDGVNLTATGTIAPGP